MVIRVKAAPNFAVQPTPNRCFVIVGATISRAVGAADR